MSRRVGTSLSWLPVLGAALWLACGDSPTTPPPRPEPVASVEILPANPVVPSGSSLTLTATTRTASGTLLEGRTVTWSSSTSAVAAVSPAGVVTTSLVTAGENVPVLITAASEGARGGTVVTVLPTPVLAVRLALDTLTLLPGRDSSVSVRLLGVTDVLLTGRPISWSATDTSIARVSATGTISARAYAGANERSTRIIVGTEGLADTLQLRVPPLPVASLRINLDTATLRPGDTLVLNAQPLDALGQPLEGRSITWSTSSSTIAAVSAAGVVEAPPYSGIATRSVAIIAATEGRSDTAAIRVLPALVGSLAITVDTARITVGSAVGLSATVLSTRGAVLVDRAITWRSTDTSVAIVGSGGALSASDYLGAATRSASVIATLDSFADTAAVVVAPLAVTSVTMLPSSLALRASSQATVSATARDAAGRALLPRPVQWTTSDSSVAFADSAGHVNAPLYLGAKTRNAQIRATIGGVAGNVTATVSPLRADTIRAPTDSLTLTSGAATRVAVTVTDSAGNVLSGHSLIWESLDANAAVVATTDSIIATNYTTPESRSTRVVVRLGALADTIRVGVVARPVHSVRLSAALADLEFNDTLRINAATLDAAGGALTQRPLLWTSTNASVAAVNDDGLVTAGTTEGEVLIIASSEGRADSARVIVAGPPREWAQVTAGRTACAIDIAGAMFCWGGVYVGDGGTQLRSTPVRVGFGDAYTAVSGASCAVTTASLIQCWGSNSFGMLGIGDASSTTTRSAPANVNSAVSFRDVQVGVTDVCALAADSTAYCWGRGQFGQLGNGAIGTSAQRNSPTAVIGGIKFAQLSFGVDHACAITAAAAAYCWGAGNWGQLGDGVGWGGLSVVDHRVWSPQLITGHQFIQIVAGNGASCGLKVSGEVFCWGRNDYGQTGDGSTFSLTSPRNTPRPVSGGLVFSALVARGHRMCGRVGGSSWYCWGTNADGLLGESLGGVVNVPVALPTAGLQFTTLSLQSAEIDGRGGFCGRLADGRGYCWGSNSEGQLGRGTISAIEREPRLVR